MEPPVMVFLSINNLTTLVSLECAIKDTNLSCPNQSVEKWVKWVAEVLIKFVNQNRCRITSDQFCPQGIIASFESKSYYKINLCYILLYFKFVQPTSVKHLSILRNKILKYFVHFISFLWFMVHELLICSKTVADEAII